MIKQLSVILALFISLHTGSWAQEEDEERLSEVIALRNQAKESKIVKEAWGFYKLGDYEAAINLWMPLAELGNSYAQGYIGLMYNQGHSGEQNINKAAKWYSLASDQGHIPSKWRLAMLYYHGSGVTQDYQKAADLYHSAAKQGDIYSQKALGIIYSKGLGVPKDNILAYSWFNIASNNGFKSAKKYQQKIANKITPEETALAQAVAKECMQSSYTKCGWTLSSTSDFLKDES